MNLLCADGLEKEDLSKIGKSETSKEKFKVEGGGRKPLLSTVEDELMEKIARGQRHHVFCKLIQHWAEKLSDENDLSEFAAARGKLRNFLKRYDLTTERRTAQSVPKNLMD